MEVTVDYLIEFLKSLQTDLKNTLTGVDVGLMSARLDTWSSRANAMLRVWGLSEVAQRVDYADGDAYTSDKYAFLRARIDAKDKVLAATIEDVVAKKSFWNIRLQSRVRKLTEGQTSASTSSKPNKVFLGHGRDPLWREVHNFLEKDKGVPVEAWESEPRTGEQVVEVLNGLLDSCTFAVLVVTGEDATPEGTFRARQNVVHEVGLFQGRLGFRKVALLEQEGLEHFSNIDGLQRIRFPGQIVRATFPDLERTLKREGIIK